MKYTIKNCVNNHDCHKCLESSFASHEKARFWSKKNGDTNPRQVFKSSISVHIPFPLHYLMSVMGDGVPIVLIRYYVMKRIVDHVLRNLLLHTRKPSFGVRKTEIGRIICSLSLISKNWVENVNMIIDKNDYPMEECQQTHGNWCSGACGCFYGIPRLQDY